MTRTMTFTIRFSCCKCFNVYLRLKRSIENQVNNTTTTNDFNLLMMSKLNYAKDSFNAGLSSSTEEDAELCGSCLLTSLLARELHDVSEEVRRPDAGSCHVVGVSGDRLTGELWGTENGKLNWKLPQQQ